MALPTQGTWRSNDYVNAPRLVDGFHCLWSEQKIEYIWYMVNQHKCWLSQTCVAPAILSYSVITFSCYTPDILYPANYILTLIDQVQLEDKTN